MRLHVHLLFLVGALSAHAAAALPEPVRLKQEGPRKLGKLKLPRPHAVGPTIPGLKQGAVHQGLALWEKQCWFLLSCDFADGRPSVVTAVDAKTQKLVRCLTLVESGGKGHAGH